MFCLYTNGSYLTTGGVTESTEQWVLYVQVPGHAGLLIANILNAEETFDMAMSLDEADAILAQYGFEDSEAELELV